MTRTIEERIEALEEALEREGEDDELEFEKLKEYSNEVSQYLDDDDDTINNVEFCWEKAQENFKAIVECVKQLKKEKDAEQSESSSAEEDTKCVKK